jgi:hypothetical protein
MCGVCLLLKHWLISERFYRESSEQQWLQWWQQQQKPNDGRKKQDLVKLPLDNLNNIQLGKVTGKYDLLQDSADLVCSSVTYNKLHGLF